jgi:hypothetical protein
MTFSASRISSISTTTSSRGGCFSLLLFVVVQLLLSSSSLVAVQAQPESLRRGGGRRTASRDLANDNDNNNDAGCEAQCQNPPLKDLQYFDGDDLLNVQTLQSRLQTHKEQYIAKLKGMYGADTYKAMFEPTIPVMDPMTNQTTKQSINVGRQLIFKDPGMLPVNKKFDEDDLADNGPAWYRMVRKYQMKLLQIQLGILEERFNAKSICLKECAAGDEGNSRNLQQKQQASGGLYTRFTWVNGGHSASAGHGNFYRESYTAELERALQPILKEIGLEFIAKNYAMGGTESAEEVALCSNSIFGRDVDSISWDYGMTDGHDQWKMTMYFYRAARMAKLRDSLSQPENIPHRPSLLGIHQGDDYNQVLQTFQEMGATGKKIGGRLRLLLYFTVLHCTALHTTAHCLCHL